MRRDFEYVTMDDYKNDMDELSTLHSNIVEMLRKKAERAERLLAEIVIASGGVVTIYRSALISRENPRLTILLNEYNDSLIIEAVRS